MTYLKMLDETKSLDTKHCSAGLSPRIISQVSPFLLKNESSFDDDMLHPPGVDSPPSSPQLSLETLEMRENPIQQRNIYSFHPTRKFCLYVYLSSAIKSVIPSPSIGNHLMQGSFVAPAISVGLFF